MNQYRKGTLNASLLERAAQRWDLGPPPALPAAADEPVAHAHEAPLTLDQSISPQPARPAAMPVAPVRTVAIDRDLLATAGMLVPGSAVSVLAEEFRLVKRHLLQTAARLANGDADAARMILVCSAQPDDGKTFCAINLAMSLSAERDVEVLLVDADFAKPDIVHRLGLPDSRGLLDALADPSVDVEDCILRTDVPQLSVLPAGTRSRSDTELLNSARGRDVLDQLVRADPRRIVLFDSPPALAASPAPVLAMHVGQVVLVVRADHSSEADLREAVALLDGCDEIQLLLNAVSFQPGGRRFGSYYGQEQAA